MSDEKRNINDINDQQTIDQTGQVALDQTAEQQAFSEEIRRRLAAPDSGKPTLEEFKVMVYKDREKRRKKRNTLVACLVAAVIVGFLTYDDLVPEVGADKNPKETIQTEDGVIIEDGGYGSSEEADNVWVTEDWEQVKDAEEIFPQLLVPRFIPDGYMMDMLMVRVEETNMFISEYTFVKDGSDSFRIETVLFPEGESVQTFYDTERSIDCKVGTIYLLRENEKAIIQIEDGIIVIYNYERIADRDIVRIIEGLVS